MNEKMAGPDNMKEVQRRKRRSTEEEKQGK
jgi:hypothetical protein